MAIRGPFIILFLIIFIPDTHGLDKSTLQLKGVVEVEAPAIEHKVDDEGLTVMVSESNRHVFHVFLRAGKKKIDGIQMESKSVGRVPASNFKRWRFKMKPQKGAIISIVAL